MGVFPFSPFHLGKRRCEWRTAVELSEPQGAGGKRPSPGTSKVEDPYARGFARGGPASAGPPRSQGASRPAPLPSPRPASPRPRPPPCWLREAGTRRRRRLLQSRLSHSLGSPAVAAPSEAERRSCEPVGQPVGGRTD